MGLEFFVNVKHIVTSAICGVANFDEFVVPAELLVGLWAGKEVGTAEEIANSSN